MSKFLHLLLFTLVLQPLSAFAQTPNQYGFPITETPPGDLPCHMVTSSQNTLNLGRLCGAVQPASVNNVRQTVAPRGRAGFTGINRNPSTGVINNRTSINEWEPPNYSNAGPFTPLAPTVDLTTRGTPFTPNPNLIIGNPSSNSGSRNSGSSGNSSGNCQFSWQTDSAGRSCGGRAASERSGGN